MNIPLYGSYNVNYFRVIWRSCYVIITAIIAMLFPFFNDFLGLIGSLSFYPLTVYFPIEMYIKKTNMPKYSFTWTWLKILSWLCLVISIISAAGSIQGLATSLKTYKPFRGEQWYFVNFLVECYFYFSLPMFFLVLNKLLTRSPIQVYCTIMIKCLLIVEKFNTYKEYNINVVNNNPKNGCKLNYNLSYSVEASFKFVCPSNFISEVP